MSKMHFSNFQKTTLVPREKHLLSIYSLTSIQNSYNLCPPCLNDSYVQIQKSHIYFSEILYSILLLHIYVHHVISNHPYYHVSKSVDDPFFLCIFGILKSCIFKLFTQAHFLKTFFLLGQLPAQDCVMALSCPFFSPINIIFHYLLIYRLHSNNMLCAVNSKLIPLLYIYKPIYCFGYRNYFLSLICLSIFSYPSGSSLSFFFRDILSHLHLPFEVLFYLLSSTYPLDSFSIWLQTPKLPFVFLEDKGGSHIIFV